MNDATSRPDSDDPEVHAQPRIDEDDDTISVSPTVEPDSRPEQPATIAGFRILGRLGSGGMGVVWEAEQDQPRRRVALKVMRRDHVVDQLHVQMFRREAETLARLRHPNIAAIYESGHTDDGHDYFAMELVRGLTLDEWLASRPKKLDDAELTIGATDHRCHSSQPHNARAVRWQVWASSSDSWRRSTSGSAWRVLTRALPSSASVPGQTLSTLSGRLQSEPE
jgi:serine/threonine protein kinase